MAPSLAFPEGLYSIIPFRFIRPFHFLFDVVLSFALLGIGRLLPSLRTRLPTSPTTLSGKTAIVTGSNSGIGLQIALDLAQLGCSIVLACRNAEKAEQARQQILQQVKPSSADQITLIQLDTSSLQSVRDFSREWHDQSSSDRKIDILVHNAGIAAPPNNSSDFSRDGLELLYATNFLGSFLLTHLLEDCLAENARVVLTSSTGQYTGRIGKDFSIHSIKHEIEPAFHTIASGVTNSSARYNMTKTMQCAFARSLQKHYDHQAAEAGTINRKVAHAFTPGYTITPIFSKFEAKGFSEDPIFAILPAVTIIATDVSEGAATGSWLASTSDEAVVKPENGGRYWDRCVSRLSSADRLSDATLDRLWLRWEADAGIEWRH